MNKPMVFLSHSKNDIDFIRKIELDFRRAGIDTWLDEIDIRHGESWLNEIFEHGIAKCDFVVVYVSPSSLSSSMVSKEIDSTLVNQLRENRIKLLLYVNSRETRNKLRFDLQTLHCPELNDETYSQLLPVVVATIWSNYMNLVLSKIVAEKNLEIENMKLKDELNQQKKSIMSEVEDEFEFFFNELNTKVEVGCKFRLRNVGDESTKKFQMNQLDIVYGVYYNLNGAINSPSILNAVSRYLQQRNLSEYFSDKYEIEISTDAKLMENFITFGFVIRNFNPEVQTSDSRMIIQYHTYEIFLKSDKFDRFMLWLKLRNKAIDQTIEEIPNT